VAFDKEEIGLLGSNAMAKSIPKEKRSQYCAMVNFDSFGFTNPYVLQNTSSSNLIKIGEQLGKENNFKLASVSIEGADTDSSSFKNKDIPAIDFSAIDGNWKNYLHTSKDVLENIKMDSVYFGFRFGLAFISKLDKNECRETKKK
jgi:Zn-dependent M28 family amino/carboxypeptidase